MIRPIARSLTAFVIVVTLPSAAYGQAPKPTVADATADTLFKEGVAAGKAGNLEKARAHFLAAYGIEKTPATLWNLASAEMALGLNVDALQHFRRWLGSWTPKTKPLNSRDLGMKYVAELKQKTGHIAFEGEPPTALKVDGLDTPLADEGNPVEMVDVTPGRHVVVASYGSRTTRQDIQLAAGATTSLHLEPQAPPPPVAPAPLPAVSAPAAPTTEQPPSAEGSTSTHSAAGTWVPVALVGGAAVLGGLGLYFGIRSSNSANDGDQLHNSLPLTACPGAPACATLKSDYDAAHSSHVASMVFYGVGAAALVGGAVTYLLLRAPKEGGASSVATPLVGPGTLGAQWVTSF